MDADIAAATTAFELDKIKAQDYRNALASQAADRESQRALMATFFEWSKGEYMNLPPVEDVNARYRKNMILAVAANYMKPNAATVDEVSMQKDADTDALKLRMAVEAAMKV